VGVETGVEPWVFVGGTAGVTGRGAVAVAPISSRLAFAAAFLAFSRSTTSDTAFTTGASTTVSLVTSVMSKADNRLLINLLDTFSCFARSLTVILSIEPPPNFGKKLTTFVVDLTPPYRNIGTLLQCFSFSINDWLTPPLSLYRVLFHRQKDLILL
jgi:hypothetical protein